MQFSGYQTILQRLCSTSTLTETKLKKELKDKNADSGDLGPEFALSFISHAKCGTAINHDVIRSMLFSGTWNIRLGRLHSYLAKHLQGYAENCCAINPPNSLTLTKSAGPDPEPMLIVKTYLQNLLSEEEESDKRRYSPRPASHAEPPKSWDKEFADPVDMEVTLQWYEPSLEDLHFENPESDVQEAMIQLIYAIHRKLPSGNTARLGVMWVSLSDLNKLHDRFVSNSVIFFLGI